MISAETALFQGGFRIELLKQGKNKDI